MSISILVETSKGETLNSVLYALGLEAAPIGVGVSAPVVSANVDNGAPQEPAEPGKRTRRTKAEIEAAKAAEAASQPAAEDPAPQRGPASHGWIVRRYDGREDGAFPDSRAATEQLLTLMHEAGEAGALQSLLKSNADLIESLPAERKAELDEANASLMAELAPKEDPKPAPAAAPQGYQPLDREQNPLTTISADKKGAQDAVLAVANGPAPEFGMLVAKALLGEFGIGKVSDLPDNDPKLPELARKAAAKLGLPMAGAPAPTNDLI